VKFGEISVSISANRFNVGLRCMFTAIEECDLVITGERRPHQVASKKPRSTENQKLHLLRFVSFVPFCG
jgi:hypothetical protein